jgi:uncharacterized repeat protein (TIGR01451 family)
MNTNNNKNTTNTAHTVRRHTMKNVQAGSSGEAETSARSNTQNISYAHNFRGGSIMYRIFNLIFAVALMLGLSTLAHAVGTPSTTSISNTVTINYNVGTIPQIAVTDDATFVVDNKVDLTVVDQGSAAIPVTPDGTNYVLTFRVTNTGNTTQDYDLSLVTVATGGDTAYGGAGADAFDMLTTEIYVNSVVNEGTSAYASGTDLATYIDELGDDDFVDVFVVLDAPTTAIDAQYASYHLVATTHIGGTSTVKGSVLTVPETPVADTPGSVDVVFADGTGTSDSARDGKHSDQSDYICQSATLTVVKSSAVISDTLNGSSNPKAIPGATVTYTITIINDGSSAATSVVITDTMPANTTYVNDSMFLNDDVDGSGSYTGLTDASDSPTDEATFAGGLVTVDLGTLAVSSVKQAIQFSVTID